MVIPVDFDGKEMSSTKILHQLEEDECSEHEKATNMLNNLTWRMFASGGKLL